MSEIIDVFISHSSKDKAYAEALTQLLKGTIKFTGGKIRCTSAYGHTLKIGSEFARTLRSDLCDADVVLAIVSQNSLNSQFCLFELGAAWGQKIPIMPILVPGFNASLLTAPLSGLHFMRWDSPEDWIKLLNEVVEVTEETKLRKPETVHQKIRQFCATKIKNATKSKPKP